MGRQGDAAADRYLRDLPAGFEGHARSCSRKTRRIACWRSGPRFRLPAEMVRDNALAVSGLMNEKIGGPSVFPYQPKGLWEEMAFGGNFSAQKYVQSHGSDLYRRSMYTFWKRTVPPPELNTFDAPDREKCTARRGITNTPLQALVLMNDPTYVEAARALAERDLREGGTTDADRIRYAFRLATDRDPSPQELNILEALYKKQLAHYQADKSSARKLVAVGESKRESKGRPGRAGGLDDGHQHDSQHGRNDHQRTEATAWTRFANVN